MTAAQQRRERWRLAALTLMAEGRDGARRRPVTEVASEVGKSRMTIHRLLREKRAEYREFASSRPEG